jgi:hypothetical protein
MSKHIEAELILPSLYLMSLRNDRTITTTDLISELRELLKPDGEDLEILAGRKDDRFSQIVRNLVSHKTLVRLGYAEFSNSTFKITDDGLEYLEEEDNKEQIDEKYRQQYEGEETLDREDITLTAEITEDVQSEKESISSHTYPNASLNIERVQYSVYELKRKKEKDKLLIDPDFQRKDVWKHAQRSELIESVLMNIPLPFIYLKESKNGELIVVDGKQRLTALFDYIDKKTSFKLNNKLKILVKLRGKKFQDLDSILQGILEDYQLTTYVIKPPTA